MTNLKTRRGFTRDAAYGAGLLAVSSKLREPDALRTCPVLCLFSKHLPKLNYVELARTVKQRALMEWTSRCAPRVMCFRSEPHKIFRVRSRPFAPKVCWSR